MERNNIVITIYRNNKPYEGKRVSIHPKSTFPQIIAMCSQLLNIRAKRIFRSSGQEIESIQEIISEDGLYITEGDDFSQIKNLRPLSSHSASHPSSLRPSSLLPPSPEEVNLAVMGPAAVGKSCLTLRYVQRIFVEEYTNTVEDRFQKTEIIDGKVALLNLLDTSGEEDFVSLRQMWLQGREGVVLVFSVDDQKTLADLDNFYNLITLLTPHTTTPLPIALVANKIDLKRQVTPQEGQEVAKKWGAEYFEVSAKTGERVDEVFAWLVRRVREGRKREEGEEGDGRIKAERGWMEKMTNWCNLI